MRIIRKLGLTTFIAVLGAAVFGAAAAQADKEVVLCTLAVLLCPGETEIYQKETLFLAEAKDVIFLRKPTSRLCETAHIHGATLASMGSPLLAHFSSLKFSGCKPCGEVRSEGGIHIEISVDEEHVYLLKGGPFQVIFEKCELGAKCVYTAKNLTLKVTNNESGSPDLIPVEAKFELTEGLAGLCGEAGVLDADFKVTSPASVHFALYQLT